MFAMKIFYKRLIATAFHNHHFKMFLKCFLSNVLKTCYHKCFIPIFSECLLNVQSLKERIEWGAQLPLSYNLRHKSNIFIGEQPEKILNLTCDHN